MRHNLLIALCFALLLSFQGKAQLFSGSDSTSPKISFGLKVGVNLQQINSDTTWQKGYRPGFTGGAFMQMGKKFGFRIEVLASSVNYTFRHITDSTGQKGDFTALNINIPAMLQYNLFSMVLLQAGAQYSTLISIKNNAGYSGDAKLLFKSSELSLVGGAEAQLPYNFTVGARYIYGLSNVNNNIVFYNEEWKHSAIQLTVGYKIQ